MEFLQMEKYGFEKKFSAAGENFLKKLQLCKKILKFCLIIPEARTRIFSIFPNFSRYWTISLDEVYKIAPQAKI